MRRRGRHSPRRLRGRKPGQPHPPELRRDLEFLVGRFELECVEQLVELQLQFEQLELEQFVQQFEPVEQLQQLQQLLVQLVERLLRRHRVCALELG